MAEVITCPSGLAGRVRGLKVREERILTDKKLARDGAQLDELLTACWEETFDAGPYALVADNVAWSSVLLGDRFFALLMIRAETYGSEYEFSTTCQSAMCRARIDWALDLTQLPVKPFDEANRTTFVSGNRFESTLPDAAKRLRFKLLVGDDERKLTHLQRTAPERALSAVLAHRVVDVDGVETRDKRAFLDDLTMRDANFLLGEFARVDCGVETNIDIECPTCGHVQEIELPFDKGFFLPTKKRPSSSSRA